jgi:hypothetical protein
MAPPGMTASDVIAVPRAWMLPRAYIMDTIPQETPTCS